MIGMKRTKYRLIREMVEENRGVARGIRPKPFHPPERRSQGGLRRAFLVVSTLCFLTSASVLLSGTRHRQEEKNQLPLVAQAVIAKPVSAPLRPPLSPTVPSFEPERLNPAVFPLAVKRIILDPGHGGDDFGAIGASGISEKEITLDIALRLKRLMEDAGFDVFLTRKADEKIPLAERADFANSLGADIFISIHVNWLNSRRLRIVETYYLGPTKNPLAVELASTENRESGYSLTDYRRLLEKVYLDTRREESHRLAGAIHGKLFDSLRQTNHLLEDRGVKTAPFIVLVGTEMPAILVEVSCLSNEEESHKLASGPYRDEIAAALFRGVRSYASNMKGSSERRSSYE